MTSRRIYSPMNSRALLPSFLSTFFCQPPADATWSVLNIPFFSPKNGKKWIKRKQSLTYLLFYRLSDYILY